MTKIGPATVDAGDQVTYALSVTNHGPSAADTVSVVDTLPDGVAFVSAGGTGWTCTNAGDVSVTCTRQVLPVGAAPDIAVVVTAPENASSIRNTARVSSLTPDPTPDNDAGAWRTTVVAAATGGTAGTGAPFSGLFRLVLALALLGAALLAASTPSLGVQRGRHVRR
jgi:uncharacterized repeat protein (TIGR01451 family)